MPDRQIHVTSANILIYMANKQEVTLTDPFNCQVSSKDQLDINIWSVGSSQRSV